MATTLTIDQWFNPTDKLLSTNNQFELVMQDDGNLVLYSVAGTRMPIWASNTTGHSGAKAMFQRDGNLVVYAGDGKQALWASNTAGKPGATVAMLTDDGKLMICDAAGTAAAWESGSLADRAANVTGTAQQAASQLGDTVKGLFSKITEKQ